MQNYPNTYKFFRNAFLMVFLLTSTQALSDVDVPEGYKKKLICSMGIHSKRDSGNHATKIVVGLSESSAELTGEDEINLTGSYGDLQYNVTYIKHVAPISRSSSAEIDMELKLTSNKNLKSKVSILEIEESLDDFDKEILNNKNNKNNNALADMIFIGSIDSTFVELDIPNGISKDYKGKHSTLLGKDVASASLKCVIVLHRNLE